MTHSFVIPVYGKSEYLRECIKSLKNQTVPSEIILTSAEETVFLKIIAQEFGLEYYINPDGNQIGKDWNYALSQADTDLVTIAHQDDIYLKDYTEKIIEKFKDNEDAAIVFTDAKEIRNDEVVKDNINLKIKKILLWPQKVHPSRFSQDFSLRYGCSICCPSVTYNKKVLGDFKFDENLKSNLDWLAWTNMHKNGERLVYLPEVLMLHRVHEKSETSKQIGENNRHQEDLFIFRQFWPESVANIIGQLYKQSEKSN